MYGFFTGLVESPLDGSIYVATNGGFSKFNLATTTFENYNRQSDFPLNNVNDGGLYITSDHDIYVCGLAGSVSIAQEKLNKQSVDYNVFVKRVLVDNTEIQPLDSLGLIKETVLYEHQLVLPPRYSSVTFEIASNTLNNISNIGLEYKLEGFDNEYMKAGDNTMVTYTNLHPGRYTFHVRGDQLRIHDQEAPSARFELIVAKILQVTKGPSVTRFELQPKAGIKVSKIVNLADDIGRYPYCRLYYPYVLDTENLATFSIGRETGKRVYRKCEPVQTAFLYQCIA